MKDILFIVDSKQAAACTNAKMAADEIFSLCPSAAYHLRNAGYAVRTCVEDYDSLAHAKTVLLVSRALEKILPCGVQHYGLTEAETSGFRANLLYTLNWSYYLYFSTRRYAHIQAKFSIMTENGLRSFEHYNEAFSALLDATLRRHNHAYENMHYSVTHYHIARWCNKLILAASHAGRKFRVLHFGDSALNAIEHTLHAQNRQVLVFKPRVIGKTIRQTLNITVSTVCNHWRGARAPLAFFRTVHPSAYHAGFCVETAAFAQALSGVDLAFPHPAFMEHVVQDSGWYMPFFKAQMQVGKTLALEIAPHLTMTNKGKYHFIRSAIAHVPRELGTSILINHGTHTAQAPGSISQRAANLWAEDDRIHLHHVGYVVPKLPLTEAQLAQICPVMPSCLHLPTVAKITRRFAPPEAIFRVVFAGNYFGPLHHIPWCAETADEYLLNVLELIEKLGAIKGVEFIIKLKARKASTHQEILQERIDALGLQQHVRIDTTTKFPELLASTHLLISNLSTTIEEAIANRVPVLLHTYRKQYFHLPCQFDPPQQGNEGAIYGLRKGADFAAMIQAIRMHYMKIIANDAAWKPLVWQEKQLTSINDFAKALLQSRRN